MVGEDGERMAGGGWRRMGVRRKVGVWWGGHRVCERRFRCLFGGNLGDVQRRQESKVLEERSEKRGIVR